MMQVHFEFTVENHLKTTMKELIYTSLIRYLHCTWHFFLVHSTFPKNIFLAV